MNYIEFDKEKLVNITFAKERELLRCSVSCLNYNKHCGFSVRCVRD